jgi:hypothetical protein
MTPFFFILCKKRRFKIRIEITQRDGNFWFFKYGYRFLVSSSGSDVTNRNLIKIAP